MRFLSAFVVLCTLAVASVRAAPVSLIIIFHGDY